jgi:hypothetical protein
VTLADVPGLFLHGWMWLLVLLGPLLFFQRRLQLELQAVLYLITRREDVALAIFALLLLPGVFLHEASHWAMAHLLGVRTRRFSLIPKPMAGGKLRMGFVEMDQVDFLREALVGTAPLFVGGALMAYAGIAHLQAVQLRQAMMVGGIGAFLGVLAGLPAQPDFWVWIYLVFAVSTTMFPSPSDRRAWLPVGLAMLAVVGVALAAGAGPWMVTHMGAGFDWAAGSLALVCGVCAAVQAGLLLPLWLLRVAICRRTGNRVA